MQSSQCQSRRNIRSGSDGLQTLFIDNLTVIDCAVLDPQRGLLGESWIVDIEIDGALDEQNMVLDFGAVKRRVRDAVESVADHRLLVPADHAGLTITDDGQRLTLDLVTPEGPIRHVSPPDAVAFMRGEVISKDIVATKAANAARLSTPESVVDVRVQLRDEAIDGPCYRYVHGLRKHDGLCQRIAHGHRSRLDIVIGDTPAPAVASQWADRWRDIYLGCQSDVVESDGETFTFAYDSGEGHFELSLPASRCHLLPNDSTVECIAAYLADCTSAAHPGQRVTVRAYEGVGKGAVGRAGG